MIFKTITKPTNMYIIGCHIIDGNAENEWDNYQGDFYMTDGESTFGVHIDRRRYAMLDSFCSHVNVLTEDEWNKHKDYFREDQEWDHDFVMLPNFTGEIGVAIYEDHGHPSKNKHYRDIDPNKILCDQFPESSYPNEDEDEDEDDEKFDWSSEYYIYLPEGTQIDIVSMSNYFIKSKTKEEPKWVRKTVVPFEW